MYDDLTIKEKQFFLGIYGLSKIRIKEKQHN
jgi:hypothetical protein